MATDHVWLQFGPGMYFPKGVFADLWGRLWGYPRLFSPWFASVRDLARLTAEPKKPPRNHLVTRGEIGCRGWIRTNDLQVMSLTSYQAAPPCNKWKAESPLRPGHCQRLFPFSPEFTLASVGGARCVGRLSVRSQTKPKPTNIHRSQGGPLAGLCVARYIR